MTGLAALWMPILASAVLVFVVSSIIHMGPFWHRNDFPRMPQEDQLRDALRPLAIQPGDYMVPRPATREEMQTPEFAAKLREGPVLGLTVLPNGPIAMGASLVQWFIYALVVSVFSAYLAGRAVPPGSEYLEVFRFAGTTAFIAYSVALWQMSIWYKRGWNLTLVATLDGLIYALLTAGTFGWLWPA